MSSSHSFVATIRILFDILDFNKAGFVYLSDIEEYWEADDDDTLPSGILESLSHYANLDGRLCFDDFMRALMICMNAGIVDEQRQTSNGGQNTQNGGQNDQRAQQMLHSTSPDQEGQGLSRSAYDRPIAANNLSRSQLPPSEFSSSYFYQSPSQPVSRDLMTSYNELPIVLQRENPALPGARYEQNSRPGIIYSREQYYSAPQSRDSRQDNNTLRQYVHSASSSSKSQTSSNINNCHPLPIPDVTFAHAPAETHHYRPPSKNYCEEISAAEGKVDRVTKQYVSDEMMYSPRHIQNSSPPKKSLPSYERAIESRRQTAGVDFQTVQSMKRIEQERDIVLQLVELLDQTRSWIQPHLQSINDRQKQISTSGLQESCPAEDDKWSEMTSRMTNVSSVLQSLMEGARTEDSSDYNNQRENNGLKMALQDCQQRIKTLEGEKILLVREIFEERCKRNEMNEDSLM